MNDIEQQPLKHNSASPPHPVYLDEHEIARRWREEDVAVSSVLLTMEQVENWTISGNPAVEAALKKLGQDIERFGDARTIGTLCRDLLIILAYSKTSRAMHMLNTLDELYEGAGLKLVQSAVNLTSRDDFEYPEGKLMVERLEILRRIRILNRIFSRSRLKFVLQALKEVNRDEA